MNTKLTSTREAVLRFLVLVTIASFPLVYVFCPFTTMRLKEKNKVMETPNVVLNS